ncbi:MAG: serine/threonine protein kinase [Acidobacteriota bacterium]|nr:serine/threonine protein kinase [Acidobacteriota bacterium]
MADQFIGQVLGDKYRIDSVIRDGDLSKVYRGTQLLMEKPVAVKILSPSLAVDESMVKRFSAEVRTLSRLSHPNIPSVFDYGQDKNGAIFIVTEQGEGETLKNAIRREGQFSVARANRITQQIASAISAANANGVLHQNLTSENIFLSKTADGADFVKVLDFGAIENDEHGTSYNVKTLEYISPERCAESAEIDSRSDIYSLGVILYEMLAGEVPFTGENATDVMLKHAQEPPLPLSAFRSDLSSEIDMIVQRALAKVPENRYQSANDLADALNRAAVFATRLSPAGVPAATAAALDDDRPQNNLWKTAFIVLAGIAVLSGFFIYMTQVKQTNPQTTLQTDANGSPVQPVNPATGMTEQGLSNLGAYPLQDGNTNTMTQDMMPGGDGYDPWARGGRPPVGAPVPQQYVPPTGQYYDGNINPGSPFMAPDGNLYIPVPRNNANTNVANTQPKPRISPTPPAAANTQPAAPTNTRPAANTTTEPKTTTTPRSTPKPVEQPKTDKPASSGKVEES